MMRSNLENKLYKTSSPANRRALKKQQHFCNRLYKRERRKYFSQLNLNKITDNKKFWSTVKPLFANKGRKDNIILVTGEEVISDDTEIAQKFNVFFKNCTNSLNVTEKKILLTSTNDVFNGVDESINKFQKHPSIMSINENASVDDRFSFLEINAEEIHLQIRSLKNNKANTFMNIPAIQLEQTIEIICEPVKDVWNEEFIRQNLSYKIETCRNKSYFQKTGKYFGQ